MKSHDADPAQPFCNADDDFALWLAGGEDPTDELRRLVLEKPSPPRLARRRSDGLKDVFLGVAEALKKAEWRPDIPAVPQASEAQTQPAREEGDHASSGVPVARLPRSSSLAEVPPQAEPPPVEERPIEPSPQAAEPLEASGPVDEAPDGEPTVVPPMSCRTVELVIADPSEGEVFHLNYDLELRRMARRGELDEGCLPAELLPSTDAPPPARLAAPTSSEVAQR